MWETSWEGVKLASIAYVLPFLWCYNPALIGDGTWLGIAYAVGTALLAALLIARGLQGSGGRGRRVTIGQSVVLIPAAVVVAASTIWTGGQSPLNLGIAAGGIVLLFLMRLSGMRRLRCRRSPPCLTSTCSSAPANHR
jgi:TRAP-type uncharacterized transport system fused permease subunit